MNIRTAAGALLTTAAIAWAAQTARAQPIPTNLHAGDFTYQFADPITGQPITTLSMDHVGDTARVAVYLLQQSGTPTNLFQQLGLEGLGVRLNYAAPAGIVMVPDTTNANITMRPPPAFNPNGVSSDYDFVVRYGAGHGTNTATSAAISEGLIGAADPLPFPGAEDPLGIGNRMLIGTFTFQALAGGTESVTAVSLLSSGTFNLTGPNPLLIGSRNDGTNGPLPGNGSQGEIKIDQLLSAAMPTLTVTVQEAGVLTWSGSASGSWNNTGNWSAGVPSSDINTQLAFGATANATMTNDIPGTLILNQLTFYGGSSAYTLTGNGLDFRTNDNGMLPQIVANSANGVTIGTALTLTNNLTVSGTGDLTLTGPIGGAGGLAKAGTGTLTLGNASNNFSGGVTISGGTVAAGSLGAIGAGGLTFDGGAFSYSGPTATTAMPINITSNNGTIMVGTAAATLTVTAAITGPGGLTKNGPGTLVLTGTNAYAGSTNINGGMLAMTTGATLGVGAVKVGTAGTLSGNGTINGSTEIAGTIAPGANGAGALNFAAPMAWDAGGIYGFAYSAVTGLNPGVNYNTITSSSILDLSALSSAKPFTIAITAMTGQTSDVPVTYSLGSFSNGGSGGGVTAFNPADFAFSGTFVGVPAVSLDSTHNQILLTISPSSITSQTWSGATSGSWNNSTNWSTSVPPSNVNTQLAFGATPSPAMSNDIPGTFTLNQLTFRSGAPVYTLYGNGLIFAANAGGGLPQINTNSANGVTIGAPLTLANNLLVAAAGDLMLTGPIGGTGGLAKSGTGTLTLGNANNSFSGGVTFSGGAVAAGSLGALGTGGWTFDGGAFSYSGPTAMTAVPIAITSNNGIVAVGSPSATLTASAAITGPGGLTKNGPGTLALSASNAYAGPTNITAGTLGMTTGATLGAGAVNVGASGTLAGNGTINGPTEIAGTIAPGGNGAGALNFAAPMVWDAGGKYSFGYLAVTGLSPGVNYTTVNSSSTLELASLTSASPFTIVINASSAQSNGTPVTYTLGSFNNGGPPGGGITGFNPADFAFSGTFTGTPTVSLDATQNQLLLTFTPVTVTSVTWTGASSGSWINSANWSVGSPPSNVNTQLTFGATANPAMTNDIPGTLTLNQMTFNAGAPVYSLTGNGLNFVTNSTGNLPQIVTNSANGVTIGVPMTLANNLTVGGAGNVTLNGVISGAGSLTYSGGGSLTLGNAGNTYTGGTVIQDGTLAVVAESALGTGPLTFGTALATLNYVATTTTTRFFILNGGTLAVGPGATLNLNGATVTSGYLVGNGVFATDPAHGARFANVTSMVSATIASNNGADLFQNFTNGGALNIAPHLATPVTLNGFTNYGSGSVIIGAGSAVNASNFQSSGVVTINPAAVGSNPETLLTNTGTPLHFNGGSRTFIGTPQTAGSFVAGIDLHGQNLVIAGGLFVNNGFVADSTSTPGSVIVDYGALYKGAGFNGVPIITQNGGKFQAGNSPGSASFGNLVLGPGGVDDYVFAINNATGTAGPAPDLAGHVSGWGLVRAIAPPVSDRGLNGDFTWTATPGDKLTVALDTLVNPTTVGDDVAGPMDNFDPSLAYSWPAVTWAGSYAGPTDAATLDAATKFDTGSVVNPIAGTFGWSLDTAGQTLSLTYTPTAVPEPGTLALSGLAAIGWVTYWRRRSRSI